MSKAAKSCTVSIRRFKTKRGKVVTFKGRSAGSKKHGGECSPKAPSAAVKTHRREFGKKAKLCAKVTQFGRGGNKASIKRMATCMKGDGVIRKAFARAA